MQKLFVIFMLVAGIAFGADLHPRLLFRFLNTRGVNPLLRLRNPLCDSATRKTKGNHHLARSRVLSQKIANRSEKIASRRQGTILVPWRNQ